MINAQKIYERLVNEGDDWADKHAAAELLEGTLKQVFSQCVLNHRKSGAPVNECEHNANNDPDYLQARESAVEARREANRAKVRYNAANAWFEAQRTAEASHRAASRAAT